MTNICRNYWRSYDFDAKEVRVSSISTVGEMQQPYAHQEFINHVPKSVHNHTPLVVSSLLSLMLCYMVAEYKLQGEGMFCQWLKQTMNSLTKR